MTISVKNRNLSIVLLTVATTIAGWSAHAAKKNDSGGNKGTSRKVCEKTLVRQKPLTDSELFEKLKLNDLRREIPALNKIEEFHFDLNDLAHYKNNPHSIEDTNTGTGIKTLLIHVNSFLEVYRQTDPENPTPHQKIVSDRLAEFRKVGALPIPGQLLKRPKDPEADLIRDKNYVEKFLGMLTRNAVGLIEFTETERNLAQTHYFDYLLKLLNTLQIRYYVRVKNYEEYLSGTKTYIGIDDLKIIFINTKNKTKIEFDPFEILNTLDAQTYKIHYANWIQSKEQIAVQDLANKRLEIAISKIAKTYLKQKNLGLLQIRIELIAMPASSETQVDQTTIPPNHYVFRIFDESGIRMPKIFFLPKLGPT